jgi:hypothetical protein
MNASIILLLAALTIAGCASAPRSPAGLPFKLCQEDLPRQELRSKELQDIAKADQNDRSVSPEKINWDQVLPRDEARRKRVGEIFGEGCFKTAQDYAAAALVYQHGNTPDHFYQTFLWAKKSLDLGDASQSRLMVMGLDRYLVAIGHKQLFATQAFKPGNDCWCMEEIEKSYSGKDRVKFAQTGLKEAMKWVDSLNSNQASCLPAKICSKHLLDSKRGTVPGFW